MTGYTKLFHSIVTSTIWTEDDQTRIVWVTMLAIADQHGEVHASIPGLARVAAVPISAVETAIDRFLSPDVHSRTKDCEGRRIEPVDGGWAIINHAKYRHKMSHDEKREKAAERKRRERARKGGGVTPDVTQGHDLSRMSRQAEAETETDADSEQQHMSGKPDVGASDVPIYSPESRVLVHFLNEQCGSQFRESESSLKFIQARLNEPDVDVEGCKKMIVRQLRMWEGTKFEHFMRPSTLFNRTKFNEYYAAKDLPINGSNPRNQGVAKPKGGPSLGELLKRKADSDREKRRMGN